MAFADRINESIRGRNLGFEFLSSGKHGTIKTGKLLVGPEAARSYYSTAETTAVNVPAFGHSILTTAVSSGVYTLDPPIPGVEKSVVFHTTGANPIYLKGANGEGFASTQGTSLPTLVSSQTAYAALKLIGVTTALWAVVGSLSSGLIRAAATT
jgi:hypothetical protein